MTQPDAKRTPDAIAKDMETQVNILKFQVLNNIDALCKEVVQDRQLNLLIKKPMAVALHQLNRLIEEAKGL